MTRTLALLALLPLLACAPRPSTPFAVLPFDAVTGIGDPTRTAIIGSAYAFALRANTAGRPDAAAQAAAQVEYLASEIPTGPRWTEFNPVVGLELLAARAELRAALGIAPEASPQIVVDALYAASRPLATGDALAAAAALPTGAFRDRQATLRQLASLPPLPRTRVATALTERELLRVDRDGSQYNGGGGDGGGRGS